MTTATLTAPAATTATLTSQDAPFYYFGNRVRGSQTIMATGGTLGMINTPRQGYRIPEGAWWIADNGRGPGKDGVIVGGHGKGWVGREKFLAWLGHFSQDEKDRAVFAVAPDTVGDAVGTIRLSATYFDDIHALGFPVAFVLQDGLVNEPGRGWGAWDGDEWLALPWDSIEAVFVGGSDDFKLSETAAQLVAEAKRRGLWAHVGRVNSFQRVEWAKSIGADSADGTTLVRGARKAPLPNLNLPVVLRWLADLNGLCPISTRRAYDLAA